MSFASKVVVVTGASRGLGQAIAHRFARDGAHLVLAARDISTLDQVAEEVLHLRQSPEQQVIAQSTDVSRQADVDALMARATAITGRVDVLVCSAGVYGPMGVIEQVDWDEWVSAIQINLFGTVLCCRAVTPVMRAQRYGKIVLLSGGGATQPLPRLSAYAASKAAVVRFAETLAEETRDAGIDVNAVAPGALNTRLLGQVLEAGPERVGADFYQRAIRQSESGGTPLETPTDLVAFLASSASDGLTGRLFSAVWDDWRNLPNRREQLADSDVYTLRRIVPQDRGWNES
jgi:NAD(P)-dependent dehydrogenase (short-subunit alcohol dehydrogenase family)